MVMPIVDTVLTIQIFALNIVVLDLKRNWQICMNIKVIQFNLSFIGISSQSFLEVPTEITLDLIHIFSLRSHQSLLRITFKIGKGCSKRICSLIKKRCFL